MAVVWCSVSARLLFADDTTLLAESEEEMRKSLQCLQSWCKKGLYRSKSKSAVIHNNMREVCMDRCPAFSKLMRIKSLRC